MKDTRYAVVLVYTDTDGFLPLVQLADKNSLFQTKKEAVAAAKKLADGLLDAYNELEEKSVLFRDAWTKVNATNGDVGYDTKDTNVSVYHIRILEIN